jgi:NAD+ kinase
MLVVVNPHRADAAHAGGLVTSALEAEGIDVCHSFDERTDKPIEAAVVLGGDGTILHAASLTRGTDIPMLGINLGHVGFLAEAEREDITHAIQRLVSGDYAVEERNTLEVIVTQPNGDTETGWALNEATVERANLRRTVEIAVEVDGRPVSTFGCDGVVVSTATGSTAHAFSAGGPILWPNVDALLFVPLAAHALFARPLVVGPESWFALEVTERSESEAQVVLDGSRAIDVLRGGRVEVRRGNHPVKLARMSDAPFTERLVRKFSLPINGWRGPVQGD